MKNKYIYRGVLLFFASAILVTVFLRLIPKNREKEIISWFEADIDGDFRDEVCVIRKAGQLEDTGDKFGDRLEIYKEFNRKDNKPNLKGAPDISFDMSGLKPLKVQAGDINGDGTAEIAVCVYKETKFHPIMAKRPFFYDLESGKIVPVWLGSRLARPFLDYILFDIDSDGIEEIVSIEKQEDGSRILAAYDWKGFGFEVKALSDGYKGEMFFNVPEGIPADRVIVRHENDGMSVSYTVLLADEQLTLIEGDDWE